MSNTIQYFKVGFQERYQDILHKTLVARKIASMALRPNLKWGKQVDRPILVTSALQVRDVTRYSDRTMNALTDSKETLTINQQKAVDFCIDSWDDLQSGPLKLGNTAGKEAALVLKEHMDGHVLAEVANAYDTFDDGDIAGTAGNPITFAAGTSGNVAKTLTNLFAKIRSNKVNDTSRLAVCLDPYHIAIIEQELIGKDIDMAAAVFKNGYVGKVLNFEMYMSLSNYSSVSLALANQVTANDYITINGVTFTYVAEPANAGEVDIGSDAAGSVDNLVAAINGAAGAGTTYIALSDANRAKLTNDKVVATDNTTSIGFTAYGRMTLVESLTHASNIFGNQTIHSFAGAKGAIDLVAQQDVMPDLRKEPKQKTVNVLTDSLYGIKTFADGAQKFLNLQLKA